MDNLRAGDRTHPTAEENFFALNIAPDAHALAGYEA